MTASNMPILWQNALGQLASEIARKAWVWFAETRGSGMQYQADSYALEVDKLVAGLGIMLGASARIHRASGTDCADEVLSDLLRFILIRHANWRLGGNVKPSYLGEAA